MSTPLVPKTQARRSVFADLSVNVKILAAVGLAAMVALVVGVTGLLALSRASSSADLIYSSNVTSINDVGQIKAVVAQAQVHVANQALSPDAASVTKFTQAFGTDRETFAAAMTSYRGNRPAGDPMTIDDLQVNFAAYTKIVLEQMLPAGAKNDFVAWSKIRDEQSTPIITRMYADVAALDAAETASAAKNAAAAKSGYESSRITSIIVLVVGLVLALALGVLVARKIVQSLARVRHVCDGLAAGDLTRTTGLTSHDEPGRMGRSLDDAMVKLRQTVATIDGSAASLAGATEQMTGTAAADRRLGAGDLRSGAGRVGRRRGGLPQRRHRVGGQRGDGRVDPGDLPERHRGGPGRAGGGRGHRGDVGDHGQARRVVRARSATSSR